MKWTARIAPLAALLPVAACTPLVWVDLLTPRRGYEAHRGISYGEHQRNLLDIYVPTRIAADDAARGAPVVVFFHGGRWQDGGRDDYRFVGQALASRGIVAMVAQYRVYPQARFPDFVVDGAAATAWALEHAASYGGDPGRVFLMGHSSGAHIAAMVAVGSPYLEQAGAERSRLAGFVGLAGPYDFLPIRDADLIEIFGPEGSQDHTQPINFVDGGEPPMLLLHGAKDKTVWPKNSTSLASKVNEAGGSASVIVYDKLEHLRILGALAAPLRFLAPVLRDTVEFVRPPARQGMDASARSTSRARRSNSP